MNQEEKEVKIIDINVEDVVKKLRSMGARKIFEGEIEDIFFELPQEDIKNTKRVIRIMQIKEEGKNTKARLEVKERKVEEGVKVANEISLPLENVKEGRKLLEVLGYVEKANKKRREQATQSI